MPPTSNRSQIRRLPQRGVYDRAAIDAILDEALVCHVGFVDDGQPFVIPTIHVRIGDAIYLHGSPASRMMQSLARGSEACITVTLVDGLVLARSAFHHSMNYRSVVLFGRGSAIGDEGEKLEILGCLAEHLVRGRWADARRPNAEELRRTLVVRVPIEEASAKVRTGMPLDDEEDYALNVWAGVLPLRLAASPPIADPRLPPGIAVPQYASEYSGPKAVGHQADADVGRPS
ncbi:MAG TPA: pyridoxamine 5'-phosphate oxidase family protein [Pirellulales bacterium]|nr:pyridoxamine 5'-phosphate oxidase family protein [Pirellulales bacterium]